MKRRGYALMMVLLLSTVTGVVLLAVLDIHARGRLEHHRQIEGYREHHAQAGLRDLIDVATRLRGLNLSEILNDQKATITLRTDRGDEAVIELSDAQGLLLRDAARSGGEVVVRAGAALARKLGPASSVLFRERGPSRVSINSAPPEVLSAVLSTIDPQARVDDFVERVGDMRKDRKIIEGQILGVMQLSGVSPALGPTAAKVFTADPTLWHADLTVRAPGGGVAARFRALLQTDPRGQQPSVFLTWDRVEGPEAGS